MGVATLTLRKQRQADPWGSLVRLFGRISELQVQRGAASKKVEGSER